MIDNIAGASDSPVEALVFALIGAAIVFVYWLVAL